MRQCILPLLLILLPTVCSASDDVLSASDRAALNQLSLEPEQWQQINELVSSSRQQIRAIRMEEMHITRDFSRISSGSGDAANIPRLAGRRAELAADRLKVRASVRAKLRTILTPDQSRKLKQLLNKDKTNSYQHSVQKHRSSGAWAPRP